MKKTLLLGLVLAMILSACQTTNQTASTNTPNEPLDTQVSEENPSSSHEET